MRVALIDVPRHAWLRFSGNSMLRNSTYLMANTVVTSLLGYAFWLVVARTSAPEVSGVGAASTSALQATAVFACVGAATAMVERLPRVNSPEQWRRTLGAGLAVDEHDLAHPLTRRRRRDGPVSLARKER